MGGRHTAHRNRARPVVQHMALAPGMYCYKFVIDDVWTMDEANPTPATVG